MDWQENRTAHSHYIEKCGGCGTILGQCRCMGPKDIKVGTCEDCMQKQAVKTKPSYPNPTDEWQPTDPPLWENVLEVASGERREFTRLDRTIHAPNKGRGYRDMPFHPKGIAWAVKQYKGFGGKFRGKKEAMETWIPRLRRMAAGGVETTRTEDETKEARLVEKQGYIRLASVAGDNHYWEITEVGVHALSNPDAIKLADQDEPKEVQASGVSLDWCD